MDELDEFLNPESDNEYATGDREELQQKLEDIRPALLPSYGEWFRRKQDDVWNDDLTEDYTGYLNAWKDMYKDLVLVHSEITTNMRYRLARLKRSFEIIGSDWA